MRKSYRGDIKPEQFEQIRALLERLWKNCERLLNTSLQFVLRRYVKNSSRRLVLADFNAFYV